MCLVCSMTGSYRHIAVSWQAAHAQGPARRGGYSAHQLNDACLMQVDALQA
jgi:hypothetical protein